MSRIPTGKVHYQSGIGRFGFIKERFNRWIGLAKRSDQPYKSHMPVLIGLAESLKPRRVAEFGMGDCSTSLFLNRDLFPTVERLTSFENDREWFLAIKNKHLNDSRFDPHLVPPMMWKTAMTLRADEFDLIFVDDSNQLGRVKTLLALRLATQVTRGPVIVVHDVELPRLRAATLVFPRRKYFSELSPQTAVLCLASGKGH
jgi:predicted O-methyltransferase YrrM